MYIHLSWFIYLLKKLPTYDSWELTVHLPPSWAKGEVNLFGRFTKKTFPTPRKEKHEKHRHIQRKHRFVGGFQPLTRGVFGDLRIARAEDLVAGAGRVAKGAVKDTVGNAQKQTTRM